MFVVLSVVVVATADVAEIDGGHHINESHIKPLVKAAFTRTQAICNKIQVRTKVYPDGCPQLLFLRVNAK